MGNSANTGGSRYVDIAEQLFAEVRNVSFLKEEKECAEFAV